MMLYTGSVRSLAAIAAGSAVCFLILRAAGLGAQGAAPAPGWVRSVEVVDDGAPVLSEPSTDGVRRGTVAEGTRLPFVRRVAGPGCPAGTWVEVGEGSYVCEHQLRASPEPPGGVDLPAVPPGRILPLEYAFVAFDGTRAYGHPSESWVDEYVEAMGEGFGIIVTERRTYEGVRFVRTRGRLWIEEAAVRYARGSDFHGVELSTEAPLDLAWVLREGAPVHARPRGPIVRREGRRAVVHVTGVERGWAHLADGTAMRDRDLARARSSAPPPEVEGDERWSDVDVEEQVLVAYEGARPVYATLVSTGRDSPRHRTPTGTFRVWVKLDFSDMDDLERTDVERNYLIESVPWVQYFEGSNGLHAAFWHDDFGTRRSHGCVNLAPRDARFLFGFTRPALPTGWHAVLPTPAERATVVRVR